MNTIETFIAIRELLDNDTYNTVAVTRTGSGYSVTKHDYSTVRESVSWSYDTGMDWRSDMHGIPLDHTRLLETYEYSTEHSLAREFEPYLTELEADQTLTFSAFMAYDYDYHDDDCSGDDCQCDQLAGHGIAIDSFEGSL